MPWATHCFSIECCRYRSSSAINGAFTIPPSPRAGDPTRKVLSPKPKRLWLEVVEGFVGGMSLASASLLPMFHLLRALFGLSMLFYGQEFATLAFHIVVFRLSGSKKVRRRVVWSIPIYTFPEGLTGAFGRSWYERRCCIHGRELEVELSTS